MRNIFIVVLLFLTACAVTPKIEILPVVLNLNTKEVMLIEGPLRIYHVKQVRKNQKIKYLILNSTGGDMQFAYNIATIISYLDVTTIIPPRGICESACTVIFQAGKKRYASESSTLMYHGIRFGSKRMLRFFKECPTVTDECFKRYESMKDRIKMGTIKMFYSLEHFGLSHDVFLLLLEQPVAKNWLLVGNLTRYSDLRFTAEEAMQYNAVTEIKEYEINTTSE